MEFFSIDFLIRIGAALALGFILGLERELTNKYAGLRTHILVCLGACAFTIISIYGFPSYASGDNVLVDQATGIRDTGRVAAQVVSGIGFIGAGAVLRNGPMIIGLTTAATLWTTASIGMAVGCGSIVLATVATLMTLFVLILVRKLETGVLRKFTQKTATIRATLIVDKDNISEVTQEIGNKFDKILEINHSKGDRMDDKEKIYIVTKVVAQNPVITMYEQISQINNIENVYITNLNFEKWA